MGEPNRSHSKPGEPRWGSNGSKMVRSKKGTWPITRPAISSMPSLIMRETGLDKGAAAQWLRDNILGAGKVDGSARPKQERKTESGETETETKFCPGQRWHYPEMFTQRLDEIDPPPGRKPRKQFQLWAVSSTVETHGAFRASPITRTSTRGSPVTLRPIGSRSS